MSVFVIGNLRGSFLKLQTLYKFLSTKNKFFSIITIFLLKYSFFFFKELIRNVALSINKKLNTIHISLGFFCLNPNFNTSVIFKTSMHRHRMKQNYKLIFHQKTFFSFFSFSFVVVPFTRK
jgi:hypothetical protein